MKELKDYAHLYRTCQAQVVSGRWSGVIGAIRGVDEESVFLHKCNKNFTPCEDFYTDSRVFRLDDIKLILRPLSDMTEDEAQTIWSKCDNSYLPNPKCALTDRTFYAQWPVHKWSIAIKEMLALGLDIFGLIDSGLAVSKTETK